LRRPQATTAAEVIAARAAVSAVIEVSSSAVKGSCSCWSHTFFMIDLVFTVDTDGSNISSLLQAEARVWWVGGWVGGEGGARLEIITRCSLRELNRHQFGYFGTFLHD